LQERTKLDLAFYLLLKYFASSPRLVQQIVKELSGVQCGVYAIYQRTTTAINLCVRLTAPTSTFINQT